jgi:hypothetical protein
LCARGCSASSTTLTSLGRLLLPRLPRQAVDASDSIMELDVVTYPLPGGALGLGAVERVRVARFAFVFGSRGV